ncbi:MAG: serine/threonine-protein kinase [Planctomycetota bacterium]
MINPSGAGKSEDSRASQEGSSDSLPFQRAGLFAGMAIGRYVLKDKLGEGTFGEVWQAHQEGPDRDVALKVLKPAGQEAHRRFQIEARTLGNLGGVAHIVTIFDSGTVHVDGQERPYIAMELLDGITLDQLPERRKSPSPQLVFAWCSQVAEALASIHARGVIHRDVKPSNIMLTSRGSEDGRPRAVLLDFGIARDSQRSTLTAKGPPGTYLFMAPEVRGGGEKASAHSDVWSLGRTLLTAVLAGSPHSAAILAALVDGVRLPVSREVGRTLRRRVGLSRSMLAVLCRALASEPSERYSDAQQLAVDLRHASADRAPEFARPRGRLRETLELVLQYRVAALLALSAASSAMAWKVATRAPSAEEWLDRADEAIDVYAISCLEEALAAPGITDVQAIQAHVELGATLLRGYRVQEALRSFDTAVELLPATENVPRALGQRARLGRSAALIEGRIHHHDWLARGRDETLELLAEVRGEAELGPARLAEIARGRAWDLEGTEGSLWFNLVEALLDLDEMAEVSGPLLASMRVSSPFVMMLRARRLRSQGSSSKALTVLPSARDGQSVKDQLVCSAERVRAWRDIGWSEPESTHATAELMLAVGTVITEVTLAFYEQDDVPDAVAALAPYGALVLDATARLEPTHDAHVLARNLALMLDGTWRRESLRPDLVDAMITLRGWAYGEPQCDELLHRVCDSFRVIPEDSVEVLILAYDVGAGESTALAPDPTRGRRVLALITDPEGSTTRLDLGVREGLETSSEAGKQALRVLKSATQGRECARFRLSLGADSDLAWLLTPEDAP